MVKAVPRTDLTTHNDLLAAAGATTDKVTDILTLQLL